MAKIGTKLVPKDVNRMYSTIFVAAAENVNRTKNIPAPKHLGILGGSNGGLLIGACLTQRPDLFGATVPAVGVLDMLRYQKFTIGLCLDFRLRKVRIIRRTSST